MARHFTSTTRQQLLLLAGAAALCVLAGMARPVAAEPTEEELAYWRSVSAEQCVAQCGRLAKSRKLVSDEERGKQCDREIGIAPYPTKHNVCLKAYDFGAIDGCEAACKSFSCQSLANNRKFAVKRDERCMPYIQMLPRPLMQRTCDAAFRAAAFVGCLKGTGFLSESTEAVMADQPPLPVVAPEPEARALDGAEEGAEPEYVHHGQSTVRSGPPPAWAMQDGEAPARRATEAEAAAEAPAGETKPAAEPEPTPTLRSATPPPPPTPEPKKEPEPAPAATPTPSAAPKKAPTPPAPKAPEAATSPPPTPPAPKQAPPAAKPAPPAAKAAATPPAPPAAKAPAAEAPPAQEGHEHLL